MKRYDLHIHNMYSGDSTITPRRLVKTAAKQNLDGIAVTNHNDLTGAEKTRQAAERHTPELDVVLGCELDTRDAHVLALGINEEIPRGLPTKEAITRIHNQGGVAVCAHPWSAPGVAAKPPEGVFNWFEPSIRDLDVHKKLDTYKFDAIETLNGLTPTGNNIKALRMAREHDLAGAGGSDSHNLWTVGKTYTICEGDVLEAIRNGDTRMEGDGVFNPLHGVVGMLNERVIGWNPVMDYTRV